ncbi:: bPH_2 [Gemmataceae bacterium]|nr:: bPH_2 [Gemmataceae bacterium]VTU01722.1 : bPH_2 [Gemmataceae bacterium]
MTERDLSTDPAAADRLWAGYHPLALAPLVAVAASVSLLVWTGQWYLDGVSAFAAEIGGWATFAVAWGVWPALVLLFLYRTVTYTYRLTDAAVYVDYGPAFRPVAPVPVADLGTVSVGGGWLVRRLGVGVVVLKCGGRSVRLKGVRNPEAFAARVRAARAAALKGAPAVTA